MKVRVVLDTNVLIDGAADDFGAPARLIDAACAGKITALVTPAIVREYRRLTRRLIADQVYRAHVDDYIAAAELVAGGAIDIALDDAEDQKFVAAAVGGKADAIVTTDRHLLDVGEVGTIRMITPAEAWSRYTEESGDKSDWQQWAAQLGFG